MSRSSPRDWTLLGFDAAALAGAAFVVYGAWRVWFHSAMATSDKIAALVAIVTAAGVLTALYLPFRSERRERHRALAKQVDRQRTTAILVRHDLAAVIRACDDKTSDWTARFNNFQAELASYATGSHPHRTLLTSAVAVTLYPQFDTVVFETVIRDIADLPLEVRQEVFDTYADIRLRGQPSNRTIRMDTYTQHYQDSLVEIQRLRERAEATITLLQPLAESGA